MKSNLCVKQKCSLERLARWGDLDADAVGREREAEGNDLARRSSVVLQLEAGERERGGREAELVQREFFVGGGGEQRGECAEEVERDRRLRSARAVSSSEGSACALSRETRAEAGLARTRACESLLRKGERAARACFHDEHRTNHRRRVS